MITNGTAKELEPDIFSQKMRKDGRLKNTEIDS